MNAPLPRTIPEYLDQLRAALAGADPALVQDALYDAEEYLRSELAVQAAGRRQGPSEAEVIASVASSYGAPEEVADIYRDTEVRVQTALRPPAAREHRSLPGRFFGVAAEPRTYAALFYMLLSLGTGIFYFFWVVAGLSLSAGFAALIIGLPFLVLFFGSVRVLSLVEGRLVEVMLGERMPRRPVYGSPDKPLLQRIGDMFLDPRSWSTLLYMLLMLPLGIAYFVIAVVGLSVSLSCMAAPFLLLLGFDQHVVLDFGGGSVGTLPWAWPLVFLAGLLLLFVTLHIARGVAHVHGQMAKHLLVKVAPPAPSHGPAMPATASSASPAG